MVTVRPGLTLVPPDGLCRTTVFSLAVEAVAVLMCAFRLRSVSLVWAVSTSSPTTSGTVTCCWPDDTYTLTVELAGSIVPQPGSVLMTWSFATVGDGWSMRCGCRRASTIFCVALAYDRPVTCGTSWVLLLPPDRKSTRLNSSHEWISYAVFCLKKKKKKKPYNNNKTKKAKDQHLNNTKKM